MIIIRTPQGNKAYVTYTYEGIPTDGLVPLYQGYTEENRIIIQPHLREDQGLLAHELTHVDQWRNYYFFNTRYKYSKGFRFKMECEAFGAQLRSTDIEDLTLYASELYMHYGIYKSLKECKRSIYKQYMGGTNE